MEALSHVPLPPGQDLRAKAQAFLGPKREGEPWQTQEAFASLNPRGHSIF